MQVDYLVVGSGLTGATIARLLHDAGREVLIVERRAHCGGNVHDHLHPSGIRIHTYGPHDFRTLEWEQMMLPEQNKGIKGTVITAKHPLRRLIRTITNIPFPIKSARLCTVRIVNGQTPFPISASVGAWENTAITIWIKPLREGWCWQKSALSIGDLWLRQASKEYLQRFV